MHPAPTTFCMVQEQETSARVTLLQRAVADALLLAVHANKSKLQLRSQHEVDLLEQEAAACKRAMDIVACNTGSSSRVAVNGNTLRVSETHMGSDKNFFLTDGQRDAANDKAQRQPVLLSSTNRPILDAPATTSSQRATQSGMAALAMKRLMIRNRVLRAKEERDRVVAMTELQQNASSFAKQLGVALPSASGCSGGGAGTSIASSYPLSYIAGLLETRVGLRSMREALADVRDGVVFQHEAQRKLVASTIHEVTEAILTERAATSRALQQIELACCRLEKLVMGAAGAESRQRENSDEDPANDTAGALGQTVTSVPIGRAGDFVAARLARVEREVAGCWIPKLEADESHKVTWQGATATTTGSATKNNEIVRCQGDDSLVRLLEHQDRLLEGQHGEIQNLREQLRIALRQNEALHAQQTATNGGRRCSQCSSSSDTQFSSTSRLSNKKHAAAGGLQSVSDGSKWKGSTKPSAAVNPAVPALVVAPRPSAASFLPMREESGVTLTGMGVQLSKQGACGMFSSPQTARVARSMLPATSKRNEPSSARKLPVPANPQQRRVVAAVSTKKENTAEARSDGFSGGNAVDGDVVGIDGWPQPDDDVTLGSPMELAWPSPPVKPRGEKTRDASQHNVRKALFSSGLPNSNGNSPKLRHFTQLLAQV